MDGQGRTLTNSGSIINNEVINTGLSTAGNRNRVAALMGNPTANNAAFTISPAGGQTNINIPNATAAYVGQTVIVGRYDSIEGDLFAGDVRTITAIVSGSQLSPTQLLQKASAKAMQLVDIPSHGFVIRTHQRLLANRAPINVYIEGDGFAYINKSQASLDPTPRQPTGLILALADNAPNVVYIARPCQYTLKESSTCQVADWTDKRFSEEMITVINDALNRVKPANSSQKIVLTGYSGDAAVAVLIAARRNDIASLRTLAGNLNHNAVNQFHRVSLMPQSLNAIDVANQIKQIPQVHFVGGQDKVIPTFIAQQFAQQVETCANVIIVKEATHIAGWQKQWPQLVKIKPGCQ